MIPLPYISLTQEILQRVGPITAQHLNTIYHPSNILPLSKVSILVGINDVQKGAELIAKALDYIDGKYGILGALIVCVAILNVNYLYDIQSGIFLLPNAVIQPGDESLFIQEHVKF